MKYRWVMAVIVGCVALVPGFADAAEHGGKEHGGEEHGGSAATTQEHGGQQPASATPSQSAQPAPTEPSAQEIRQSIRDYIAQIEEEQGAFTIEDEVTNSTRTLTLVRVHERVGKTGSAYYSCTDMRDANSGELLDLDFDVEAEGSALNVVDVRIHKLNGKPRYTYDDNDQRIPLM